MSAPGPRRWRSAAAVSTVLVVVGTVLLLPGMIDGAPVVDWGTPEEDRLQEAGRRRMALGLSAFALVGALQLRLGGRVLGITTLILAVAVIGLTFTPTAFAWPAAFVLIGVAVGGILWMLLRAREANGRAR